MRALALALLAAAAFAGLLVLLCPPDRLVPTLLYDVPIGVPFVLFLLERRPSRLDLGVIALALVRAVYALPLISGHALFLSYALGTARTWLLRAAAALVLGEVLWLKYQWGDWTALGGILLGTALAAWRRGQKS